MAIEFITKLKKRKTREKGNKAYYSYYIVIPPEIGKLLEKEAKGKDLKVRIEILE